jgi:glucan phosphoethanolaminetransferase (alkaline phosphatase superfamily)
MEDIKEQTGYYFLVGLTLVLGLAWNEAITSAINQYYPLDRNGLTAKFIYALAITLFVVFLSRYIKTKPQTQNVQNVIPN